LAGLAAALARAGALVAAAFLVGAGFLAGAIFFAAALGAALVRAVAGVVLRVAMAGFSVSCKKAFS
jgi:hypothetical protein